VNTYSLLEEPNRFRHRSAVSVVVFEDLLQQFERTGRCGVGGKVLWLEDIIHPYSAF